MPNCLQSITVNAPIEDVWNVVSQFHDFSWGSNVISKCEQVGPKASPEIGAQRILNGVFHETLIESNAQEYRIRYSIDDGPSPLSKEEIDNYIGQIQLRPVTVSNTTLVEWSSSWNSESEDAVEFCSSIYALLLKELANRYE